MLLYKTVLFTFFIIVVCVLWKAVENAFLNYRRKRWNRKQKKTREINETWKRYEACMRQFEGWLIRYPGSNASHADAQALLLQALGELAKHIILTEDSKSVQLLETHFRKINSGPKRPSKFDVIRSPNQRTANK